MKNISCGFLSLFYLLLTQKSGFYSKAKKALAQMKYKPLESTAEVCWKRKQANLATLQLNDFFPFGKTHRTLHISGLPFEHFCFTNSVLNLVSRRKEKRKYWLACQKELWYSNTASQGRKETDGRSSCFSTSLHLEGGPNMLNTTCKQLIRTMFSIWFGEKRRWNFTNWSILKAK